MSSAILTLNDINIFNSDRSVCLLEHITMAIKENEFYVVLGENGAGKSTLLYTMQGEVNRYVIEGERQTSLTYIPLLTQQVEHYFVGQTAWEEFVLTLEAAQAQASEGYTYQWLQLEIDRVVRLLDLQSILYKPLHLLSGGQLQLVALASLLLLRTKLILIDEMTTMLDAPTRELMLNRIRHIQKQTGCTIVYVTHAGHEVRESDHVIYIDNKTAYTYTPHQLSHRQMDKFRYKTAVSAHTGRENEAKAECRQKKEANAECRHKKEANAGCREKKEANTEHSHKDEANEIYDDEIQGILSKPLPYVNKISQIEVKQIKVIHDFNSPSETYSFNSHRLTYINGKNGAGKSTLLKAIATEIELASGEIVLDKQCIAKRRFSGTKVKINAIKHISYCPQFLQYVWSKDNVFEECLYTMKCSSMSLSITDEKQLDNHIKTYLNYFYIDSSLYERQIYTLSAGQQRRLALALCFMLETSWILLDEPYAYLDEATCTRLSAMIEARVKQGCGVLLVSHEYHHINVEQVDKIELKGQGYELNEKTEQKKEKASLLNLFHPTVLLVGLLLLSIVLFLYANLLELLLVFLIAIVVNSIVLKGRIAGLIKLIIMFSLFMGVIACFSALQLPQWSLDVPHMNAILLYGYKLLTMILLTFSLFELISPFRLMRVLQQAVSKIKGSQMDAIRLYLIVLIFRFMTILQLLWGKLIAIYRVKYKRFAYQAPIAFLTHFLRETLFIAEAIIINYELRQPLRLSTYIYKVKIRTVDLVLLITLLVLSVTIVMF